MPSRIIGWSAIGLALAFNIPYAILAFTFDYPDILRSPAGVALDRFAGGGSGLVLTWYGFTLSALALVPMAIGLAITPANMRMAPGLAAGAAIAGALGGLAQAIGLSRWVFAVPALAAVHADPSVGSAPRAAAEQLFVVLNSYGGVAIGEHLGQLLTALFVLYLALLQRQHGARRTALAGLVTATALAIGTGEGLALAIGRSGSIFSLFTIAGFLLLTLWLIATGVGLIHVADHPASPSDPSRIPRVPERTKTCRF